MPERLRQLWEDCKQITVYQAIIVILSIAGPLGTIYAFAKPIAVRAANTAITNIMIAQGIDPLEFKDIPQKVQEQGEAQLRMESDLATIKNQQQELLDLLRQQTDPLAPPQPLPPDPQQ